MLYYMEGKIENVFKKLLAKESGSSPMVVVKPLSPENRQPPQVEESKAKPLESPPAKQIKKNSMAARPLTPPEEPVLRKTRLFFITIDPAGKIAMKGVVRPIPASDTPLKDALSALLAGPNSQEVNLGFLSMIPSEVKLKSATVKGDTAVLDFTESFRFNTLGMEGLAAQLKQVVYAATEFPTVKKVQILIEGKRVQYLGTEGVRIDQPLSRESFRE